MDVALEELVIASLRRETRARHDLLESVLQLVDPLTYGRYLHALRGFELFLRNWEPRVSAALPSLLRGWFASRSRYPSLQQDLSRLDDVLAVRQAAAEVCAQAMRRIDLDSVAATFGSMYVLEGSALGGQVIAKAARETLGLGRDNGAAYFNGLQSGTAAHWSSFRDLLETEVGTDLASRQQACRAARQTFDALISTFTALGNDSPAA